VEGLLTSNIKNWFILPGAILANEDQESLYKGNKAIKIIKVLSPHKEELGH
jgi:hypothetical protein